jgi:2-isopropylmalate synthase
MSVSLDLFLLDSTLREGEQADGVCFSVEEKLELCHFLQNFGVDFIEVGHPGISAQEEEICKKICQKITRSQSLVHSRACRKEVLAAKNSCAHWVGIWASYNDLALSTKYTNKSRDWIQKQVFESVSYARELGLKVRFTIEDASRTSLDFIKELAFCAISAGAHHVSFADTVGAWHPRACATVVQYAVENFNVPIEVHLHNDLGLAHANAIAAIDSGAQIIDVSILGLGERAGICDLFSFSAVLKNFYGQKKYNFKETKKISKIVSRIGAFIVEPHRPIVGKNAFTHASSYHVKAVQKEPLSYEFLKPQDFDLERKISLQKYFREHKKRFLDTLEVQKPFLKSSVELKYHREGVGKRWVLMDHRIDERSLIYVIERIFEKDYSEDFPESHVDVHEHCCDSFFIFMGEEADGSGLFVNVTLGEQSETIGSPASLFIPAFVKHKYEYLKGKGRYLNIVLSPDYQRSLVELRNNSH